MKIGEHGTIKWEDLEEILFDFRILRFDVEGLFDDGDIVKVFHPLDGSNDNPILVGRKKESNGIPSEDGDEWIYKARLGEHTVAHMTVVIE